MHHDDVLGSIGETPLVELKHCSPRPDLRFFAKLEAFNPTGSVKDRIAREMVLHEEDAGRLSPGDTIVVASTGNTGISLSMVGRARGYQVHVVMPKNVYPEIARTLEAYRAEIEWVPADKGVREAIRVAQQLADDNGWICLDQFSSRYNVDAHHKTTGPEIVRDLDRIDAFVAGLGTGGTLMGVGERLKEAHSQALIVAVEPHPGYQVQGLKSLADGFVPPILDFNMLDSKILVRSHHAFRAAAELMKREAIFGGISSGAVLHAALKVSPRIERGNVVLLFADSGWKYLETQLWTEEPPLDTDKAESLDDTIWW
jgi:cysteine synthase B